MKIVKITASSSSISSSLESFTMSSSSFANVYENASFAQGSSLSDSSPSEQSGSITCIAKPDELSTFSPYYKTLLQYGIVSLPTTRAAKLIKKTRELQLLLHLSVGLPTI